MIHLDSIGKKFKVHVFFQNRMVQSTTLKKISSSKFVHTCHDIKSCPSFVLGHIELSTSEGAQAFYQVTLNSLHLTSTSGYSCELLSNVSGSSYSLVCLCNRLTYLCTLSIVTINLLKLNTRSKGLWPTLSQIRTTLHKVLWLRQRIYTPSH